ncbi:class I SAM-dependent methyltransferase [Candidatus Woesearchaeota archaeon]|nr:class I SAM-dependent methyltransferase [Candidatus Woesearchaeota archaeon]MBW3005471.1 class I SAM-dependent methyltransferase [Candidatus Woesearchaeota archaeon]
MTKQIVEAFPDAYTKSAPAVLNDLHQYLLDSIENHLVVTRRTYGGDERSLLVIGPGPQVLPFSSDRDRLKGMMGLEGKIVLMDCVFDAEKIGQSIQGLAKAGFFDSGYFRIGTITDREINPETLDKETISYQKGDLRKNLMFPDKSFTCVDATLSIHHATPFEKDLDKITQEIYRILKPGGFFHFGTGAVDMKYSEKKIDTVANDLIEFYGDCIIEISDERDRSNPRRLEYNSGNSTIEVRIDEYGMLHFPRESGLLQHLQERKYAVSEENGEIVAPLINPDSDVDRQGIVEPVSKYYAAIQSRAEDGERQGIVDSNLMAAVKKAAEFEKNNAARGIIEFYTKEERIIESLQNAGFKDIQVQHHARGPFYNITAGKPLQKRIAKSSEAYVNLAG